MKYITLIQISRIVSLRNWLNQVVIVFRNNMETLLLYSVFHGTKNHAHNIYSFSFEIRRIQQRLLVALTAEWKSPVEILRN